MPGPQWNIQIQNVNFRGFFETVNLNVDESSYLYNRLSANLYNTPFKIDGVVGGIYQRLLVSYLSIHWE